MEEYRVISIPSNFNFTYDLRDDERAIMESFDRRVRLTLDHLLGSGDTSKVYRCVRETAVATTNAQRCAIKILDRREQFENEIGILRLLSHEKTVGCDRYVCCAKEEGWFTVKEGNTTKRLYFILLELMEGPIWKLFDAWPGMCAEKIYLLCDMIEQVCEILNHLINRGVFYGDIRTDNFLFNYSNNRQRVVVKVSDVGNCATYGMIARPNDYSSKEEFMADIREVTSPRLLHMFYIEVVDDVLKASLMKEAEMISKGISKYHTTLMREYRTFMSEYDLLIRMVSHYSIVRPLEEIEMRVRSVKDAAVPLMSVPRMSITFDDSDDDSVDDSDDDQ